MEKISAETAIGLILAGKPLNNYYIRDTLDLYKHEGKIVSDVIIEDCEFEKLASYSVEYRHPVRLSRCLFHDNSFNYAYFLAGLTIDHCVFETYLDFESGGHNQYNKLFTITNSTFHEFVNFFDCWFQSGVIISNNDFRKGTNLLGNRDQPYSVQFDIVPVVENNVGEMDLDGEGGKDINTVYLF